MPPSIGAEGTFNQQADDGGRAGRVVGMYPDAQPVDFAVEDGAWRGEKVAKLSSSSGRPEAGRGGHGGEPP